MKLHYFNVPLVPDTIAAPILKYREGATTVNFGTSDLGWGRLTFEKLDSIRVCRGEYSPYPRADKDGIDYSWVSTVSDSKWLRERYDYEKRHYGKCYEFKGNVEEMLSDYIHWVFSFHDEYIEALSAGIWFESAQSNLGDQEPDEQHPLQGLSETTICERFGEELESYHFVPVLETIRVRIDAELAKIHQRRVGMGKAQQEQLRQFEGILEELARQLNLSAEELKDEILTKIGGRIERELLQDPEDDEADWWK